jgi:hypothetical protein
MFVSNSFGVYVDSETARYHFDQLPQIRFNHTHYNTSIDEFLSKDYAVSVASFHVPFPKDLTWIERLERVYNSCNRVLIFCSEVHDFTVEQMLSLDKDKVSIYLCGVINQSFKHAKVHFWLDWFHTSSEFYARTHPGFLDSRLRPYAVKPKLFDILLGNQRPHRDFVYHSMVDRGLTDQVIMTYSRYSHISILDNPEFLLENDGVEYYSNRNYTHSVDKIKYHGSDVCVSQVVPLQIYNQTAYSLVAETNFDNRFNFYTEKVVKPMMAKRLFVAIAGQHYLRNLKNLGFQTFDGIIDEEYDSIQDPKTRWTAAIDQIQSLIHTPQELVLEKVKPIAEHNYQLIIEKNWYQEFITTLGNEIQPLVNDTKITPTSFT